MSATPEAGADTSLTLEQILERMRVSFASDREAAGDMLTDQQRMTAYLGSNALERASRSSSESGKIRLAAANYAPKGSHYRLVLAAGFTVIRTELVQTRFGTTT